MSKKCVCDFCGTCFRHKSELQHHVNGVHLKLKPFQCESCELSFTLNGDLKKHVKEVHQKLKAHKCEYCSASFSRKYNLKVAIFLNLNFYIYWSAFVLKKHNFLAAGQGLQKPWKIPFRWTMFDLFQFKKIYFRGPGKKNTSQKLGYR